MDEESDIAPEVPSAVGTAINAAKKEAGPSGLLTEIYRDTFAPAQKLWGEERRRKVSEQISARREGERNSNLRSHLEWARGQAGAEGRCTAETEKLITDWLDGAQDVDPNDEDLSAVWRAVFKEIRSGSKNRKMILSAIRDLRP